MVEMISHGQITNAAFYNYTTLSDLKVISAMLKDVANSWNFKTTLIRISKTVTIDKLPFDFLVCTSPDNCLPIRNVYPACSFLYPAELIAAVV